MTVKDIFDLRKQGKIEEAYEAIRPMYAVHQGKYTTLCMFWTASDILKKRISEQRFDEAEKIFKALLRVLPHIEDQEGRARRSVLYAAVALDKQDPNFCILDLVSQLNVECLSDEDWTAFTPVPSAESEGGENTVPSVAQLLLIRAFCEIEEEATLDNALKVMPLLQEALRRFPHDKRHVTFLNRIRRLMSEAESDSLPSSPEGR